MSKIVKFSSVVNVHLVLFYSEAKTCLADKRVAFLGDSRIRQLFYSFVKIINTVVLRYIQNNKNIGSRQG